MHLLLLNDDVLAVIISFLSSRDALNFSVTARGVHSVAKQHALSVVTVSWPAQIRNMCRYMMGDVPDRLHWLRELTVHAGALSVDGGPYSVSSTSAALLVDLFQRADNLTHLYIDCFSGLIETEPRAIDGLGNLRSLRTLALGNIKPADSHIFANFKTRPRRLKLHLLGFPSPLGDIRHFPDVEDLELNGLSLSTINERRNPDDDARWLTVKRLTIENSTVTMVELLHAFPNVRVFRLGKVSVLKPPPGTTACWSDLDYVTGLPHFFGSFGTSDWPVKCPVQHLELVAPAWESPNGRNTVIRAMALLPPVALSVRFRDDLGFEDQFWAEMARVTQQLRCLEIILVSKKPQDMPHWISALAPSNLICLRISIRHGSDTVVPRICPQEVAERCPSLRYFALPPRDGISAYRWWKLTTAGENRMAREITAALGEQVQTYLRSPAYDYKAECSDKLSSCSETNQRGGAYT